MLQSSLFAYASKTVHTVALEIKLVTIKGFEVRVSLGLAGVERDRVAVLDPVHHRTMFSSLTSLLLALHLLCFWVALAF